MIEAGTPAPDFSLSDQDGFLGKILGGFDTSVPIPLEIGWESGKGLRFGVSAGLDLRLAPHLQLGPIALEELHLVVGASAASGQDPPRLQVAIGVVIGAAFGTIVSSIVDDIFMPLIGLVLGGVDFSNLFLVLSNPADVPVPSLAAAKAAGSTEVKPAE